MLKSLPTYRQLTSLIPRSGVQFLDFGFDIDDGARISRAFWEEATGTAEDAPVNLHCLERDPTTRDYVTKDEARTTVEPSYVINADRALDVFLGQWVPVPFLRIRERAPDGSPVFARGPSNWARVRVVALDEEDRDGNTHRVTLAFDTELAESAGNASYLAPTSEDARSGQVFSLAEDDRDNSWFIADDWVDEWLYEMFIDYRRQQRGGRAVTESDLQWACEHYARYLTLLQVLADLKLFPRIQLVDTDTRPRKYRPIGVDLVLDVGNSRTCGILIEADPDDKIDLNNSYVLELRDLTRPQLAYNKPFESRLEFARPAFGRDHLSRRSGRPNAFNWPLVARVGPESSWLASQAKGTEGATGMSSPKRYLWDTRPRNQDWRFNGLAAPGTAGMANDDQGFEPPVTTGIFVQHLTEEGVPLDDPKLADSARIPALRARYSRSSLMIFALAEIILHGLVMANSAEQRGKRPYEDVPRQLERVIMTMPTAMPKAERDILRHRAEAAVRLLWKSMGWDGDDPNQPQPPRVMLDWDEASCTQLVYLYSEIAQKFQGDIRGFFNTIGRERPVLNGFNGANAGNGAKGVEAPALQPSLRVASIDIGGGTTDLIITTYRLEGDRTIAPLQEFREGFNIAGDDILSAVIERHVMPAVIDAIEAAGATNARTLITELFGGDWGDQSERDRTLRRQFANRVALPIGIQLLERYEGYRAIAGNQVDSFAFDQFFDEGPPPGVDDAFVRYLADAARDAGAVDFDLHTLQVPVNMAAIDATVRSTIAQVLADMSEIVFTYECDMVLLSGRPSRFPAVTAAMFAKPPVPVDRIKAMHHYRVGSWYPFRDAQGRIHDPKTTAVVGAMLCALGEGDIEAFSFRSSELKMRSTARFVGEMERTGALRNDKLLFRDLDLDDRKGAPPKATFTFEAPTFIGFRQLNVERWPGKPLYWLDFDNPRIRREAAMPLRVTLSMRDNDFEAEEETEGDFEIIDIVDRDNTPFRETDLELRLQTLKSEAGYWLDTGIFNIR